MEPTDVLCYTKIKNNKQKYRGQCKFSHLQLNLCLASTGALKMLKSEKYPRVFFGKTLRIEKPVYYLDSKTLKKNQCARSLVGVNQCRSTGVNVATPTYTR